jgi:hypothetical protein
MAETPRDRARAEAAAFRVEIAAFRAEVCGDLRAMRGDMARMTRTVPWRVALAAGVGAFLGGLLPAVLCWL